MMGYGIRRLRRLSSSGLKLFVTWVVVSMYARQLIWSKNRSVAGDHIIPQVRMFVVSAFDLVRARSVYGGCRLNLRS